MRLLSERLDSLSEASTIDTEVAGASEGRGERDVIAAPEATQFSPPPIFLAPGIIRLPSRPLSNFRRRPGATSFVFAEQGRHRGGCCWCPRHRLSACFYDDSSSSAEHLSLT